MTLDTIVARCSKFSGWKLTWEIDGDYITIEQKDDRRSRCVFGVHADPQLLGAREVVGRLRHFGITWEEELVIVRAIRGEAPAKPLGMVSPFELDA